MNYFSLAAALLQVYTLPRLPSAWQRRLTERRVVRAVRDAYFNVPFYRRKYDDAGVDINRIRSLSDIKLLPVLTKKEVRDNFPQGIVRRGTDLSKCHRGFTTGSTGRPLSFVISPAGYAYYLAESARIYSMIGYRPWHRSCYIRLVTMSLPSVSSRRQTHISTGQPVAGQIAQMRKFRPDLIDSGVSRLLNLARQMTADDRRHIRPRAITLNAEMSAQPERDYLSSVFGCPVYDEYATEETWSVATQCRKHRYHISSDSVWLEFLDGEGRDVAPGEAGDIFITTTRSDAMPFIRYAIGDRGIPEAGTCDCGYRSPLMHSIEGRRDEWLVLPSGKLLSPSLVNLSFTRAIWRNPMLFDQIKIIQKTRGEVVVQYVRGSGFTEAEMAQVIKDIESAFPEPVHVTSEEAPLDTGAKRRVVQSLVPR